MIMYFGLTHGQFLGGFKKFSLNYQFPYLSVVVRESLRAKKIQYFFGYAGEVVNIPYCDLKSVSFQASQRYGLIKISRYTYFQSTRAEQYSLPFYPPNAHILLRYGMPVLIARVSHFFSRNMKD